MTTTHINFEGIKVIGIDPGLKGGICCLFNGVLCKLIRMPLTKIETKTKKLVRDMTKTEKKLHKQKKPIFTKKEIIDSKAISDLIKDFSPDLVVIEKAFYSGVNGTIVAGTTGENLGRILGVCEAESCRILRVQAAYWKSYFDLGDDKEEAIAKAEELYPSVDLIPGQCKKKQDGLAEALLLARYGLEKTKC
jgi:Holliday junction resolvasome RuvABC endonuclease subunit